MVMTVASDQAAQAQETVYGLHAVYFRLHEEQRQAIPSRPGRRRGRFINDYIVNSIVQLFIFILFSFLFYFYLNFSCRLLSSLCGMQAYYH